MNVLIAGGGTGGHIFPALAIARELQGKIDDLDCVFVGTDGRLESKVIPREGFELKFIRSEGLVGRGLFKTLKSLLMVPVSIKDSCRIIKGFGPDLVVGVGGYSSGPVLLCAKLMGIPTMIHEQNTVPGLANKILGRFADIIALSYQESLKYFPPARSYLTGNPVRKEMTEGDKERGLRIFSLESGRFTIFVFGGSAGAGHINRAVCESLEYLMPYKENIQFLHQTGENDLHYVKQVYHSRSFKGTVIPFTFEMGDAYAAADLVISRAGATTLAELTACGKASILVPYPFAAADHQEKNAGKLVDMGAARMILDGELDGRVLADMIIGLINDRDAINQIEKTSSSLGSRDAAAKVVELAEGLLKKKRNIRRGNTGQLPGQAAALDT